jgi:hypothetical protein
MAVNATWLFFGRWHTILPPARPPPLPGADTAIRQSGFHLGAERTGQAAIGKYVTVFDYPDGRLSIHHNGVELAYRTLDKVSQVDQGAIADNKQLGQFWR